MRNREPHEHIGENEVKITKLIVDNIRGINLAVLEGLGDVVAIAGANGCGKSCLLDCVRLFKSQYGSYYANEEQMWWQEKSLNINDRASAIEVLRKKNRDGQIIASIKLEDTEKQFILEDKQRLMERLALLEIFPGLRARNAEGLWNWRGVPELALHEKAIVGHTETMRADIQRELEGAEISGRVIIFKNGTIGIVPNRALTYIFSTFEPDHLGVIDFHAADRSYTYEQVSNINIRVAQKDDQWKNSAIYNLAQKYSNVKAALATESIRNMLAEKAGAGQGAERELTDTLRSIFEELIPGKRFEGATPTKKGELQFPVHTEGAVHDLNELSSGEKEVVFGYLRTRARAARNSVIIVDEPELHLNPAMIRGLPLLYQKHIGQALNNQIWLVTHSDVFLRTAFYDTDMELFHMAVGKAAPGTNQITRLTQESAYDRTCIELIGDVANYRPDQPVLIVEGQQQFDILMLRRLFAEELKGINVLEAGGKQQVLQRQHSLRELARRSVERKKVVSITDSDGDTRSNEEEGQYQWPAYHIENYLLEPRYIAFAVDSMTAEIPGTTKPAYIKEVMERCQGEAIEELGQKRLVRKLKAKLNSHLQLTPGSASNKLTADEIKEQMTRCKEAINKEFVNLMTNEGIEKAIDQQAKVTKNLHGVGVTHRELPGREILKLVASKTTPRGSYEALRNAILNEMGRHNYQPEEMKRVLERCLQSDIKT